MKCTDSIQTRVLRAKIKYENHDMPCLGDGCCEIWCSSFCFWTTLERPNGMQGVLYFAIGVHGR